MSRIKNIGPKSESWLNDIGIFTVDDVEVIGVVEVYRRLKLSRPNISLVMLYALQGAVMDMHWQEIPDDVREDLIAKAKAALEEDVT
ncbi:MAG: TfoX/Sxy family protein [Anaerolineaceae bacterium]|nr:TfoX/Sxy family protein [Anaerolineaceae bacterium]